MNILKSKHTIILIISSLFLFGVSSCQTEAPTLVKILIVDENGTPIPGASVRLHPSPTITPHGAIVIDRTAITDAEGYALFDFSDMYNLGQSGFAVLDIEVNSDDTLFGQGIIKVVEERLSEEQVIIQ